MNIGGALRRARQEAGLSQRQLAQLADVPASTIGRIERGQVSPTVQMLERLAGAMGLRLSMVFASTLLELVQSHAAEVERICARHGARNPRVFGSAARYEDDVASDVDLMVDLDESADLFSLIRLERDLRELLGVDVDVIPRSAMNEDLRRAAEAESAPV
jgi:uncharacterized protein